jgi:hypothetical protein
MTVILNLSYSIVFLAFCYINEGNFEVCLVKDKDMIDIKQLKDYFKLDLMQIIGILFHLMHLRLMTSAREQGTFINFPSIIILHYLL